MKRLIVILVLATLLSSCATMKNPHTYAVCTALDVGTTVYALNHGFVEANPIWAAVIEVGGIPLFIIANVAIVYLVYKLNEKYPKEAEAVIPIGVAARCGAGIYNAFVVF